NHNTTNRQTEMKPRKQNKPAEDFDVSAEAAPITKDETPDWDVSETEPVIMTPEPMHAPVTETVGGANGYEFPASLRDCLSMLTALDNQEPPKARTAFIEHQRKLRALKAHVHRIQQGPTAPVMDANTQAAQKAGEAAAHDARATRLAALKNFLSRN